MTLDYDPAQHYDRVTRAWGLLLGEELHYGVFDQGDEDLPTATGRLTALMIEGARFQPGDDVLDVGCGSGAPACRMVSSYGVNVLGITTSEVGVAAATQRAADMGLPQARFEQRDGTDNGLPDESFDVVWVLESSHLMPDRAALLTECARVLRPGGRLVLCDLIRRREIPFLEVRERRAEFATLRAAFGAARMDPLESYAALAEERGLVVDRAQDLTEATRPTFDRWRTNLATHRAEVEDLIGVDGADEFGASVEILRGLWDDGTLGYGIMWAHRPA